MLMLCMFKTPCYIVSLYKYVIICNAKSRLNWFVFLWFSGYEQGYPISFCYITLAAVKHLGEVPLIQWAGL